MEPLALAVITLCLSFILALLITAVAVRSRRASLPPGPAAFPIIGNLHWFHVSINSIESLLRRLRRLYGPVVTLHIGAQPAIFIFDRDLAHEALVHNGAAFAGRMPVTDFNLIYSNNGYTINDATYGPLWRLLRRNLTSEILHPSRVRLFSKGREWALGVLVDNLRAQSARQGGVVTAMDAFQYAMFCLLVLMCFGERPGEGTMREIERIQRESLAQYRKNQAFAFFPRTAKFVFPKRWKDTIELRQRQCDIYFPLIQARRRRRERALLASGNGGGATNGSSADESFEYSYVDSLIDLVLQEENGRKLTDQEIAGLCSEFLNGGTDTTSTMLQWIMANLVKHPEAQAKLYHEVINSGTAGASNGQDERESGSVEAVSEEDLPRMPYLKAVILEGLRRHPPGHFVLPHVTTRDVAAGGYAFPKGAMVNFAVAEMGWDEGVWKEPMKFRPERFLAGGEGEGVDVTGTRGIKMMPFGVGRRMCPGYAVAMHHLEYFVANLVALFEWGTVDGEEVDLDERLEFTVVMKNPLRARLAERRTITT